MTYNLYGRNSGYFTTKACCILKFTKIRPSLKDKLLVFQFYLVQYDTSIPIPSREYLRFRWTTRNQSVPLCHHQMRHASKRVTHQETTSISFETTKLDSSAIKRARRHPQKAQYFTNGVRLYQS
jgi:hypothetical protein